MGLVGNEGGSLGVKNEASRLPASRESHIHLSLLHLVDVSIGRHCEEVAILILSGTVEGNCHLEEFLKVCWLSSYHF